MPRLSDKDESLFRQYETDVLDEHHKTLRLWKYANRPAAVFAALAQFDCFSILSLLMPEAGLTIAQTQQTKNLEEGLTQAIRWLHDGKSSFDLVPDCARHLVEWAGRYCTFAGTYVDIADFHKMYGRKQLDVEIDEATKTVRFATPAGQDARASLLGMFENSYQHRQTSARAKPVSKEKLRGEIHKHLQPEAFEYMNGRILLADHDIILRPAIGELFELIFPKEPLPLEPGVDLVGFSVEEFDRYYDLLRRWSFCRTFGFLSSITQWGKQQWECVPTEHVDRSEFISRMSQLTGLSDETVHRITERLTYDARTTAPDIFQQPLICGGSTVSWSTSIVQSSRAMRNMLKVMSRTVDLQNHAATLIGTRDRAMLQEFGKNFATRGKGHYKLNVNVAGNNESGDIDLLAYNRKFPDELLLVEAKAMLAVDEINEVDAATKELQHGQAQLKKVERILNSMTADEKHTLFKFVDWPRVSSIYGVVVAAEAEPNDKFDHSQYPGISLQTINARLRDNHFASPRKLWEACRDRRWIAKIGRLKETYRSIRIGEVRYEIPYLLQAEPEEPVEQSSTSARLKPPKRRRR